MRVLGDGGWCKIQVGRSHSPIFIIFWLYYPFFVFTKWWYACFHLLSPDCKKNYDETWHLYPRVFLPIRHGVRSVSTGVENDHKCSSYVITDRYDACVCDECPVKKPLKSFLLHQLGRKPWQWKFKMLNWPFSSHSLSNRPFQPPKKEDIRFIISVSMLLSFCFISCYFYLAVFVFNGFRYSYFKKRCREKSKKS